MHIRLLAPFRCHFNIKKHQMLADEEGYCRFWHDVKHALATDLVKYPLIGSLDFLHSRSVPSGLRYQSLHETGSLTAPEVLRVHPAPTTAALIDEAAGKAEEKLVSGRLVRALLPQPATLLFRIYDDTLGLAEMVVEIAEADWQADGERICLDIQTWSNAFMHHLVTSYYRSTLLPLAVDVWRCDRDGKYVETPGNYRGFAEVTLLEPPQRSSSRTPDYDANAAGQPLWVNRSLHVNGLDLQRRQTILRHWVSTADDPTLQGQAEFVSLGWGHNVFHAAEDSALARHAWDALLLCQYFYTVLESANLGLLRYFGQSLGPLTHGETKKLDRLLRHMVASVNLLVMRFNDTQQNLQGHRQAFFVTLRSRWHMDTLVQNIEKKIGVVTGQIHRLHERSVKTSQTLIQMILCAIGGITLIGFCLSLSQYARSAVVPPEQGPAGDGIWGLLDLAAAYPPDAVIWGGVLLLLVLLTAFWQFQRRGR